MIGGNIKKSIRSNIIGFILGGIMCSGINYVCAVSFNSGDVSHTKSNGTTTTVQAALNDLYTIHSGGTAAASEILSGKTAYSGGSLKTGTMSNYGSSTGLTCSTANTSSKLYVKPSSSGYYTSSSSFNTGIDYNPTGTGESAATSGTSVTSSSTGVALSGANLLLGGGTKITIPSGYYSSAINISSGGVETTLWTNSSPTSSFAGQDVTLSSSYLNFKYIQLTFNRKTDDLTSYKVIYLSSEFSNFGKSPSSDQGSTPRKYTSAGTLYTRTFYPVSATSIHFNMNRVDSATNNGNSANTHWIPISIIGLD